MATSTSSSNSVTSTPTSTPTTSSAPSSEPLLPSLSTILPESAPPSAPHLTHFFEKLLEPSPPVSSLLVPALVAHPRLAADAPDRPQTLKELLDLAEAESRKWTKERKAELLRAHPRIGESRTASLLSRAEQGQVKGPAGDKRIAVDDTPPEVLARLGFLNALYEHLYPSLRFMVFVNGRSRAALIPFLESVTGWPSNAPTPSSNPASPSLPQHHHHHPSSSSAPAGTGRPPSGYFGRRDKDRGPPDTERLIQAIGGTPHTVGDEVWTRECERGLGEVWDVARNRVEKLEKEGLVGEVSVGRGAEEA